MDSEPNIRNKLTRGKIHSGVPDPMSGSNWRVGLASIGFIVAVLALGSAIGWILWPGAPTLPEYGWQETADSDYQPGGRACEPAQIERLGADAKSARQREACEDAAEQHRIQTNDLKQQTRAADAAAASVWIAEWQSKATVFGLIVGFYTLAAASAAAIFAKQAADETRRSAEAAENAVAESRRIGEAQVRCYISISNLVMELEESGALTVNFVVTNSGQSPARECRFDCQIGLRDATTGLIWKSPDINIFTGSAGVSIASNESKPFLTVKADLLDNFDTRNTFVDSTWVIADIITTLQWRDIFGLPYEERYRFYTDFDPSKFFTQPIPTKPYTAYGEEELSEFRAVLT